MKLTEAIIDKIKTQLEDNLPAKLDTLDTEYIDDIVLDNIKNFYISEQKEIPEFPAIEILADDVAFATEEDDAEIGVHNVIIATIVTDQNETNLTRRLLRYNRAVTEVLIADRTLGGSALTIHLDKISRSPMITDKTGTFMKDSYIMIKVWTQEV